MQSPRPHSARRQGLDAHQNHVRVLQSIAGCVLDWTHPLGVPEDEASLLGSSSPSSAANVQVESLTGAPDSSDAPPGPLGETRCAGRAGIIPPDVLLLTDPPKFLPESPPMDLLPWPRGPSPSTTSRPEGLSIELFSLLSRGLLPCWPCWSFMTFNPLHPAPRDPHAATVRKNKTDGDGGDFNGGRARLPAETLRLGGGRGEKPTPASPGVPAPAQPLHPR